MELISQFRLIGGGQRSCVALTPTFVCLQSANSLRCRIFRQIAGALWENAHGTFSRRLHPRFASGSLGMRPAALLSSLMLAISGLGLHHPRVGSRPTTSAKNKKHVRRRVFHFGGGPFTRR